MRHLRVEQCHVAIVGVICRARHTAAGGDGLSVAADRYQWCRRNAEAGKGVGSAGVERPPRWSCGPSQRTMVVVSLSAQAPMTCNVSASDTACRAVSASRAGDLRYARWDRRDAAAAGEWL